MSKKLGGLGGGKGTGSGGGSHRKARARSLAVVSLPSQRQRCHYLGGQWFLYH